MNKNFANGGKLFLHHVMPVMADCKINVGATGAVSSFKGSLVSSVTRLGVGTYQIKLIDNLNRFFAMFSSAISAPSGSAIDPHTGTVGNNYVITAVGNTNWSVAGVPAGVTPAIGVAFTLAAQPAAGTGTVKAVGNSGVQKIEMIGDPNLTMSPSAPNQGAIITVQCLAPTSSSVTTLIPADPTSGSILELGFLMSNSSVLLPNE